MKEKIYSILEELCPLEDIEDETLLIEMGILDSLTLLNLIDALEKELKISIPEDTIKPSNFATVNSICDWLEKY